MSQTTTINEIAAAFGVSKQAVQGRANNAVWLYQEESHPGGKRRLYPLASLPKPVRDAVMAKRLEAAAPIVRPESSATMATLPIPAVHPHIAETTEAQRAERDARCLVEREIYQMMDKAKCTKKAAMTALLTNARAGCLAPAIEKALRLARDRRGRQGDGYPSLVSLGRYLGKADKTPKKRAKDFSVKPWHAAAVDLRKRPQGSTITWIHEELIKLGHAVNYDQVYRFFRDKFSQIEQLNGRYSGSQLRAHRFYQHRTAEGWRRATRCTATAGTPTLPRPTRRLASLSPMRYGIFTMWRLVM